MLSFTAQRLNLNLRGFEADYDVIFFGVGSRDLAAYGLERRSVAHLALSGLRDVWGCLFRLRLQVGVVWKKPKAGTHTYTLNA